MKFVKLIVMFPLCFFLPGYVFLRSSLFDERSSDWLTRLLVVICFSASVSSLIALLLAEIGFLRLRVLAAALAFVCLAIWLAFSPSGVRIFEEKPQKKELAAVIALLILGIGMFFIPSEHIVGDGDPGYYYNTGYHLAETGSLTIKDDYLKVMDGAEKKTFFGNGTAQFMPYHVGSYPEGTLDTLLYHLLPVWIAIFIRVFGPFGGSYVIPFFSLLSMLALFCLARRFSSTWAAGASTALATVFYLQVWCSKSPVSEILCQFFILASLLFFVEYLDRGGKASAIVSGLCVTVAALARPEAALFIVFMLFVLFVWMFISDERRGRFVFPNVLLVGSLCVVLYMRFPQYLYLKGNMEKFAGALGGLFAGDILMWALPAIFLLFLFFNLKPLRAWFAHLGEALRAKFQTRSQAIHRWIKAAICVLVFGFCAYLYFYAPHVAPTTISPQRNLFDFSVFLGGAAFFIFLLGFVWLLYESNLSVSFLFAACGLAMLLALHLSVKGGGYLPWPARRYVTVFYPLLFVGFAYLMYKVWMLKRKELQVAVAATAVSLFVLFCFMVAPILKHVEYKGVDTHLATFASGIGSNVICFTGLFPGEAFGIPLRYQRHVDARRVYDLSDAESFAKIVNDYLSEGRYIYIELSGMKTVKFDPELFDLLEFRKAFDAVISFPRLSRTSTTWPRWIGTEEHAMRFFLLAPKAVPSGR